MDAAGTRPPRRHAALWTVAVAAAAAGAALRFVAPSPMWLDEVLSVNIASLSVGDAVQALRHDGHPLLYYAVLGVWLDGFGDSDLAARSLSGAGLSVLAARAWCASPPSPSTACTCREPQRPSGWATAHEGPARR